MLVPLITEFRNSEIENGFGFKMKNDLSTTKVAPNSSPVTYSQYGEDLVIRCSFLAQMARGFYVDVGANDPDILSNTKLYL